MPDVPEVAAQTEWRQVDNLPHVLPPLGWCLIDLVRTTAMETLPPQSPNPETRAEQFTGLPQSQRDQMRDSLAAHCARLERAEAALEAQLQRLEENTELQRQLIKAQSAATGAQQGGRLDWEAEKRRVMAALESDFDRHEPQQQAERLRIEDVLQSTERALAEKDRQIEELTRRLGQPGGDDGVGADRQAEIGRLLDADSAVQQERERLKELQEQGREKLRQAEIDLSLQRAKFARDRAELDERIRLAESEPVGGPVAPGPADRQNHPAHGRWLARLGLTDEDRESGKQGY